MNAEEIKDQIKYLATGLIALLGSDKAVQYLEQIINEIKSSQKPNG